MRKHAVRVTGAALLLAWTSDAAAQGPEAPPTPRDPPARPALDVLLQRLSAPEAAGDLTAAAREIPPILERTGADVEGRAAAGIAVRAAIRSGRDRLAARLRAGLESSFPDQIPRLKAELARRRESAVGLIMDDAAYPETDRGGAAQRRVDERVAAVRALWDNPLLAFARLSPAVGKDLETINAAAAGALSDGGLPAGPDDPLRLEALLAEAGNYVSLFRSTPADGTERKLLDINRRVLAANAAFRGPPPEAIEQAALTNAYREMMGRRVLELDEKLCRAAQAHSEAMARRGALWHQGEDGTPASRLALEKYEATALAENVCGVYATAAEAHDAWCRSPGHHRNLLDPLYNQFGIGVRDGYWTQDFGRGRTKTGGTK